MSSVQAHQNYMLDSNFKRICTNSSMERALLIEKRATFSDLASMAEASIREIESANSDLKFWRTAEAIARIISVASDVFLTVASGSSSLKVGQALMVSVGKSNGELIAKAINREMRTKDGVVLLAKNKAKTTEYAIKSYSKDAASKFSLFFDALFIGNDILDHVSEWEKGSGEISGIETAKKLLKRFGEKLREIDEQLFAMEACQGTIA